MQHTIVTHRISTIVGAIASLQNIQLWIMKFRVVLCILGTILCTEVLCKSRATFSRKLAVKDEDRLSNSGRTTLRRWGEPPSFSCFFKEEPLDILLLVQIDGASNVASFVLEPKPTVDNLIRRNMCIICARKERLHRRGRNPHKSVILYAMTRQNLARMLAISKRQQWSDRTRVVITNRPHQLCRPSASQATSRERALWSTTTATIAPQPSMTSTDAGARTVEHPVTIIFTVKWRR